jgi:hypothetical protein
MTKGGEQSKFSLPSMPKGEFVGIVVIGVVVINGKHYYWQRLGGYLVDGSGYVGFKIQLLRPYTFRDTACTREGFGIILN